jgi:hypothetical protein
VLGNLNISYDVGLFSGLGIDDERYVISLTTCCLIALSWADVSISVIAVIDVRILLHTCC